MKKCLIFVLLLCSLLLLFGPQARAKMTGDMLNDYKSNINTLYDKGIIGENTKNYLINNAGDNSYSSTATGYFFVIGHGNNGNYNSDLLSTEDYLYVGICRNANNVTNANTRTLWTTNNTSGGLTVIRIGLNATTANGGVFGLNNLVDGFWCYTTQNIRTSVLTLDAYNEIGASYITNNFIFEPFPEPTKTLNGVTYYIKNISRTVPDWRLGTLTGITDDYYTAVYEYYTSQGWRRAFTISRNVNTSEVQIYVPNNKIYYNNGYSVYFSNDNETSDRTYFLFLPIGESVSGDLNSGDLLYTGFDNNDDMPIISSIDNQYTVDSGEVGLILDDYFVSGNYLSGDYGIFTEAYNHDLSNSYFDRLYTLYRNILYTLLQQGNVTLDIQYRNYHLTLNSSDFTVPNNPIKTMVMTLLIVWTFFLLYQQLDLFIRNIQTLNLFGFLHDTDVDYHMFL